MATRRSVPDYGLPIVTPDGLQTQEFNDAVDDLIHAIPLVGTGSPEGVISARETQFYVDSEALPVLYVKQVPSIGGDTTLGWVSASVKTKDYASAYWTENTDTTSISVVDTWTDITGVLVESASTADFSIVDNSIIWNGISTLFFLNLSCASTDADGGFDVFEFGYSINDITALTTMDFTNHLDRPSVVSINQIISLESGDVIIPQMQAITTAADVVASTLNFSLTPVEQ